MSVQLTSAILEEAWGTVHTAVRDMARKGRIDYAGTVVVLDPKTCAVVFQARVHDTACRVAQTYDRYAHSNAEATWRTGLPSGEVEILERPTDTHWAGAVIEDGIVVSFSGSHERFNEIFSRLMLDLVRMLASPSS